MAPRQHALDSVADELALWLEETADALADALMDGGPAPFAAPLTEAARLRYFTDQMFNPDGSINVGGRAQLMQRYGVQNYADIARAVLQSRQRRMQPPLSTPPTGGY